MIKNINARMLVRALSADGFYLSRTSGSHRIYRHSDGRRAVVSYHHLRDNIHIEILSRIFDDVGWNEEDLIRLELKKR
jgi:predicted RNA binding protein YcfA (HicA-like mRNA interferase family)